MGKKKLTFEMEQLAKLLQQVALPSAQFELDKSRQVFATLMPQLQSLLGQGFTPEELAAMNAQAIEGTGRQFDSARSSLIEELGRRGLRRGGTPISGEALRRTAELGGAQAISTSDALRQVLLANAAARRENTFNSLGLIQGLSGDVPGSIGAATNIAQTQAGLSATRAGMGGGFWKSLGSSLLGAGLGAVTGGIGTALGAKLGGLIYKKPGG